MKSALPARITCDPGLMSGQACIRGLRVTVANILAAHHSPARILEAYPYLEPADIDACLEYAALLAEDRQVALSA